MDHHTFKTDIGSPYDIASLSHDIFWTHWGSTYIYWADKYYGHSSLKRVHVGEYFYLWAVQA